ncbi:Fc.00g104200.m01.CDS01 [Cosmosporella sp. VM-42]
MSQQSDREKTLSPEAAYDKAKRLFQILEGQGIISVRVLQAGLLLSLYEAANAIYPAAFLTAGHCARIGHALGIHDRRNVPQMFPNPMSWTELEEHRRLWWGVIVMDRFIHIGLGDRPFACDDARPEDLLPMNEGLWELGEQTVIPSLAVDGDTTIPAPGFARTCQAAHLLSRVLSNIGSAAASRPAVDRYTEAQQLYTVLRSFCLALQQELPPEDPSKFAAYSSAMGICYSALIALCDNYSCAEMDDPSAVGIREQLMMQETALRGLHEIGELICAFACQIENNLETGEDGTKVSPLVAQCLYCAAKQYIWYFHETGKMELLQAVDTLMSALRAIRKQWNVAAEYLVILEADGPIQGG